jgi:hypothetical protein
LGYSLVHKLLEILGLEQVKSLIQLASSLHQCLRDVHHIGTGC